MKWTLMAVCFGFLLDLLLGDPRWLYHPVRIIGNGISLIAKSISQNQGGGTGSRDTAGSGDRSGFSGGSFWNFVSGVWMEPLAGTDIGDLYVLSAFGNKVSSG